MERLEIEHYLLSLRECLVLTEQQHREIRHELGFDEPKQSFVGFYRPAE